MSSCMPRRACWGVCQVSASAGAAAGAAPARLHGRRLGGRLRVEPALHQRLLQHQQSGKSGKTAALSAVLTAIC